MVLESILNPKKTEARPYILFVVAFVYTFVAAVTANHLFPSQASVLTIAFITMLFIPLFQKLYEIEEFKEDMAARRCENNIFSRHKGIIVVFSAFFLGTTIAMSFVYIFFGFENVFALQKEWFVTQGIVGTGNVVGFSDFFINNTQVMLLTFVLSTLFGAGALFILAWNASIIGVYTGLISQAFAKGGIGLVPAYLYGLPVALGSIAIHGVPEITAYFVAGIAGGILSVGIIKEKIGSPEFKKVFTDSIKFLMIAEALIIFAAWLEVVF